MNTEHTNQPKQAAEAAFEQWWQRHGLTDPMDDEDCQYATASSWARRGYLAAMGLATIKESLTAEPQAWPVNQQLLDALKELASIVEIHSKATDENFAWAELSCARQAIAAAEQAQADDTDAEWRRLALQFDGHRMQALAHLRCFLENHESHADAVRAFLTAPPLSGEQVLTERIAAMCQSTDDWQPSGIDYDRSMHGNPDAGAWAKFFVETFPALKGKEGLMLGWFANAMMAMHDHLKAQQPASAQPPVQQQAVPVGYVAPDELPELKNGVCAFLYPQPDRHATQPVFAQPPAVAVPSAVIGGIHLDMMCAGLHSDKAMADELWRVLQRHLAVDQTAVAVAVPDDLKAVALKEAEEELCQIGMLLTEEGWDTFTIARTLDVVRIALYGGDGNGHGIEAFPAAVKALHDLRAEEAAQAAAQKGGEAC